MPAILAPGLELSVGYNVGEDGWGPGYNADMTKLSVLVQSVVFSFVSELPDAPTDGDRHILSAEDSNSGASGSILYRINGEWAYLIPEEGWEVWNIGDLTKYRYTGGVWVGLAPTAPDAYTTSYSSGDDGDSNSTDTNVGDALDEIFRRIRVLTGLVGGTPDAYSVTYSSGEDGDSNSVEVNVGDALDDLYRRLRAGGASSASAVSYDAGTGGDSNSVQTTVQDALDDLYGRLRVIDPAFMFQGVGASENKRATFVATRPFSIPINCVGSQAYAATAVGPLDSNSAGETVVFNIQKNGANVGTITFEGGSHTGIFAMASLADFAAGDRLSVLAPASLDTLVEVSITFMGSRHA